ncbi:SipW-dependent-type signal peptide-containing protein [Brevibacterium sp. CFH 10365]|uniref:SipW-dependent-type signal peptide-containing protein n=1 Tax=Brevibacterium sp. CFH 10365 TaxID=2585207 RepID=UPI0018798C4E|nr:SipW-dependent-type signal peptide-containing protein [Brevibacterium sp. CFH 10365]
MRQRRARLRRRRIKAILAGGLVFGIGAVGTVAAWTDTETADGSFTAGTFTIELSTNGTDWENAREMTFASSPMFPGSTVFAPVFVKTSPDTSIGGELTVTGNGVDGTPNPMEGALHYRAVGQSISADDLDDYRCDENSFKGSPEFVFGGATSTVELSAPATAESTQNLESVGGSIEAYCFEVSLPSDAPTEAQDQPAEHTWTFDAESVDPQG